MWADPTVLLHETFGDNSGSARSWTSNYSVKSGVPSVYCAALYTVTNAKQSKNTTGSGTGSTPGSALTQTTMDTDASIIIGPLNVAQYDQLKLTYKWKAASVKGTYSTSVAYKTSANGDFTTIKTYGNTAGATSLGANGYVDADYTLPAAATSSTLYLKIVFNTSNTQALIDEVELTYTGDAVPSIPSTEVNEIPVCTMSIATCTYSKPTWTHNDNSAYTLGDGATDIGTKDYSGTTRIKWPYGKTYTLTVPSGVTVTRVVITGASTNTTAGTQITIDGVEKTIASLGTDVWMISTPSAGASISIDVAGKEFGMESIVLYTADGKTLTTTDNMDGWRSFYDATQDYTLDANTKAYVVRAKSGTENQVELTELDVTAIPHGEAVILKTSAADHKMVLTKTTGVASLGTNLLDVTDGSHNYDGYRLGYGSIGVGFYKYTATAPAAGIVYLDPENVNLSAGAPALCFVIDGGNTTAIKNVDAEKTTAPRKAMKDGRIVIETAEGMFSVSGARVK